MLLILAGVAISTLTGDNGLLKRVEDAKIKTEEAETIKLSRYIFDENGKETDQEENAIYSNIKELSERMYNDGNAIAKDIEAFKNSANDNGGYYLGRYEAGLTGEYTLGKDSYSRIMWTGTNMKLICRAGEQVYNYVRQLQASELSRNMYTSDTFTSDLTNSYAWDTAILFIQKFGEESNSSRYSKTLGGSSTSTSEPQVTGTNILEVTGKTDKQCNVYDMSGNTNEWTTETCTMDAKYSCIYRGSAYNQSR